MGGRCIVSGCDRQAKTRGWCHTHYMRWYVYGDVRADVPIGGHYHHGSRTPEWRAWKSLLQRCLSPSHRNYANYGGRGIAVCERWRESFPAFLEDMGTRPSAEHSIDRIDNDGNYEPGNCRWATRVEQGRNRRTAHIIEVDGLAMTVTEWAERTGVKRKTIFERLRRGWPPERAVAA